MTIKLGNLLNILREVVVAVPAVVEAIKPIIHEIKGKRVSSGPNTVQSAAPAETPTPSH